MSTGPSLVQLVGALTGKTLLTQQQISSRWPSPTFTTGIIKSKKDSSSVQANAEETWTNRVALILKSSKLWILSPKESQSSPSTLTWSSNRQLATHLKSLMVLSQWQTQWTSSLFLLPNSQLQGKFTLLPYHNDRTLIGLSAKWSLILSSHPRLSIIGIRDSTRELPTKLTVISK